MNKKIFKLKITSDEVKKFHRNIEIKSSVNFFDLHDAIQSEVGFDKSQLTSFFITNENWQKKQEICLFDVPVQDILVMDETILSNQIKKVGQKLIYKFDFKLNRYFKIELIEILEENRLNLYPLCSDSEGNPPRQVMFNKEANKEIEDINIEKTTEDFGIDNDFLDSLDNFENETKQTD